MKMLVISLGRVLALVLGIIFALVGFKELIWHILSRYNKEFVPSITPLGVFFMLIFAYVAIFLFFRKRK